MPVPGGLGVHITLDLAGQARFGPDVEWIPDVDYAVDPRRGDAFYAAVRRYWPGLRDGALQPGYAGIRPKISGPNEAAADFVVQGPEAHGVPGLVNLYGIESPGLTASLPLADEVLRQSSADQSAVGAEAEKGQRPRQHVDEGGAEDRALRCASQNRWAPPDRKDARTAPRPRRDKKEPAWRLISIVLPLPRRRPETALLRTVTDCCLNAGATS